MFNPWAYKCEVTVGPIKPDNELRITPPEFLKYIDRVRSNTMRNGKAVERFGNMLIHDTRFNYFDSERQIGLACGEYTDRSVLQNFKRFIIQPDVGFMVENSSTAGGAGGPTGTSGASGIVGAGGSAPTSEDVDDEAGAEKLSASGGSGGVHSDLYRRQIPRESLSRMLDMPIFNGTNVKNVVQSGKSLLYYLLTYLLANCMRMYVLPGPRLPCFSAILPLHALCTIFDLNIDALPEQCLVPIEKTRYAYLADSLNVKYMFVFPVNVSFFDRRDPVIHDGGIDTCDKLFLTDDEFSDFRVNCTLNCKNRNEDYDGDTNNPGFCKGIESHTEIKYNMRTHLMPLLRNRHIFSQNILYRLFVILAVDEPTTASATVRRDPSKSIDQDLHENVSRVIHSIDVVENESARQRAIRFFGPDHYLFYHMYIRENLKAVRPYMSSALTNNGSAPTTDEDLTKAIHKLDAVWKPSKRTSTANCFSIVDNMIRSMCLVLGDAATTEFVDSLLRRVHDTLPYVFTGEEPMCFTTIVNVLSTAKGNFDDILLLQRNFEAKQAVPNDLEVPLSLVDLLMPITDQKLQQNKQYLDNFVYGSKKVPKNSKLAISTKWTLQNVIYYEGDLYIDGRVVLPDFLSVFSYELFLDIDVVCAIFDSVIEKIE
jgi:hypothetical protein